MCKYLRRESGRAHTEIHSSNVDEAHGGISVNIIQGKGRTLNHRNKLVVALGRPEFLPKPGVLRLIPTVGSRVQWLVI